MNLHEHQGKLIVKKYGVTVPDGCIAESPEKAVEIAKVLQERTGTDKWAVKAQIHAGGRGKGGGVKIAKSLDEVKNYADQMIGMNLVTPQTGSNGKLVRKVLIEQNIYYPGKSQVQEFYMSFLLNRKTGHNMIMYSPRGGMDIEAVAKETPDQIFTEEIDPKVGLQDFQARKIAFNLGLTGAAHKKMLSFVAAMENAYTESDASLFEINPVIKAADDKIFAADCKVTIDNNALFRHPDILELRDLNEEDPIEVEASRYDLNYVKLDGNVGCMVNGAGLAMATMDMIKMSGGEPANFLDDRPIRGTGEYYYEDERYVGLICLEDTLVQIDEMGIEHGWDVDRVLWLGKKMEKSMGKRLRSEAVINGRTLKQGHMEFARPGLKKVKEKLGEKPGQKLPE